MEKIGAYYQCYKNRESLNFVLENFRKNYIDSTVVLLCDGGYDFESEARNFNCHYFYETKLKTKVNLIFENFESCVSYLERLKKSLNFINENFFILLEDDVYVIKTVTDSLFFDINGCNFNEFLSEKICKVLNDRLNKNHKKYFYGGFGGCILNKHFFINILSDEKKWKKDIGIFYENSTTLDLASDKILSFLCIINNGTIGNYDGFCETWYNDYEKRMSNKTVEVLHQYKKYYK